MGASYSIPLTNKVVVITGCDTGFGHALALECAERGAITYALCLTTDAVDAFTSLAKENPTYKSLRSLQLDVTDWESIQKLAATMKAEHPEGIFALVNNAGIHLGTFFTWTTVEETKKIMDVNYMGVVYMMKAFIPLLHTYALAHPTSAEPPRIVNIASVAGRLTSPILPGYCASKHALEALSASVRVELRAFGIRVALIEPWFAATPLVVGNMDKRLAEIQARFQALPHKEEYDADFLSHATKVFGTPPTGTMPPSTVIRVILRAITVSEPKHHYLVGTNGKILVRLFAFLPSWFIDILSFWSHFGFRAVMRKRITNGKRLAIAC
ncbi:Retinol dehydrogenase 5 [Gaertneriomyces sp. JEL0708]|nr:Retinol dehydrogenase 5 [Gaertneriomyces sp. JEL0708]